MLFSVLILSTISIPSFSNDKLIPEVYGSEEPSACELNTLDDLAHQFMNNNAYIQMHTDDGMHPQNTGPGDMAIGEIRGNIGPAGTNLFSADINKDNQVSDTPHLWHAVTATGTIQFNTGHHSDHIDFTLTVNDLHNVTGIHIHQGNSTTNSPIHLVDLLTGDASIINGITSGPIPHMNTVYSGEITVDDLCPGAHDHGGDDGFVGADDFIVTLNSDQTTSHSDSTGTGTAVLQFDEDYNRLNYEIILSGFDLDGNQTTDDHDHMHTSGFTRGVVTHSSDTSTDEHEHEPSACELNTLDDLAHQFMNNNAYIQMHTDDGMHPQNTGPGDMAIGEIRGNIGPAGTNLFSADINKDNQVSDTPHLWHAVTATGFIVFFTGHHSDHIDFSLTVNDLHNVTGIHIHQGNSTTNSPIHLVDLLTGDASIINGITSGPIPHMNTVYSGEITVDDLCPGAHDHGGDDEHEEFVNDGGHGTSDGHEADDVTEIHLYKGGMGETGHHVLTLFNSAFVNSNDEDDHDHMHTSGFTRGVVTHSSDTSTDEHEHEPSACELNTLDDLAHQFMNNNAYIQMHTDDGMHPQNTGPGDMAIGEIRGNIGPAGTNLFSADINKDNQVSDTPHLWHAVTATGTIQFNTGHHSDHIDFTLTVNDLHNVTGIHIHQGNSTTNSPIHLVDLLTGDASIINGITSGPIPHMNTVYSGEITVDDLCPGAHDHGGDDEHGDDGHEEPEPENHMTFDASTGTISGIWDNGDSSTVMHNIRNLISEQLYIQVNTEGYPDGAIRGQITLNEDDKVLSFFGVSGGSSGGSSGASSGGGGARSSILAPHVVMYNACSEELDGIMRIVTFNQKDRDLRVQISHKDFSKWAVNVSDEVSYLKYIDDPNGKYEYSVFDARYPADLEKVWIGLYDTKNKKKFIHHYIDLSANSCLGSEIPFALKDPEATLLTPFEPLEIPQPEIVEPSAFEIMVSYEGKLATQTFNLITEHKPVFQKFEDPTSLKYIPMPWNDSWNDERQCYEIGERNRHHCSFNGKFLPEIAIAQEKFAEITWSEPVRQNFDEKKYYDNIYRGAIWLVEK